MSGDRLSPQPAEYSRSATGGLAPVVVFAYARPEHLQRTVESLSQNPEAERTDLHVYCDGSKSPHMRDRVNAVREYVASIDGFASVHRVYRDHNIGLAQSVIDGVSSLLQKHDRVIVVEDDLLLSPHFLRYMNDALTCYSDDARVASVHGYNYPIGDPLPETFFLRGADCWGWATWARAWRHFNPDGQALLTRLQQQRLMRAFDLDGAFPFTTMLKAQIAGRNDSWAIRWHAACFADNLLTLYPGRSLVENIGNDASGTHCAHTEAYARALTNEPVTVERIALSESETARQAIARFLRGQRPSLISRARRLFGAPKAGAA